MLAKYDLPDPDNIKLGTDIKGFMRHEIPEVLRKRALRSLWKSNPVLAVLDGLNDYDEDFTMASTAGQVVNTLYKVGQGMIDRSQPKDDEGDDALPPATSSLADPDATRDERDDLASDHEPPPSEVAEDIGDGQQGDAESVLAPAPELLEVERQELAPKRPPRMQFQSE